MPRPLFIWSATIMSAAALFGAAIWFAVGRDHEPSSYAGLQFHHMTRAAAGRTPWLSGGGVLVKVAEGGPAARAGLKTGDVVAKLDGVPISSPRHASDMFRRRQTGERIELTTFRVSRGEPYPRNVLLRLESEPLSTRKLSVHPLRTLEKRPFKHPPPVANAAWTRRIAKGATIKPMVLRSLRAGRCSGLAPAGWRVTGHYRDERMIHLAAGDGDSHAIYRSAGLGGSDPQSFIDSFLNQVFGESHALTPKQVRPFGFVQQGVGNSHRTGFIVYRVTEKDISLWAALVPVSSFERKAVAGAVAFTLDCNLSAWENLSPLDSILVETAVSQRCRAGRCNETDLAATYLSQLKLGYAHNARGDVFLVNPHRDLWGTGEEGAGFYHQVGGAIEKLEPGRTN